MERLILNVLTELSTMKLDVAKIRVNMMNEECNPYAVTSEISSLRIRLDITKRILTGVMFPDDIAQSVMETVRKLNEQLYGLEESRVKKRAKQSTFKERE